MEPAEFYNQLKILSKENNKKKTEDFLLSAAGDHKPVSGYNATYVAAISELAAFYRDNGQFDASFRYYKELLDILGTYLGKDSMQYATTLTNLAGAYGESGNYKASESYYLCAMQVYENKGWNRHYLYACVLDNLALLYLFLSRFEEGEKMMLQAIDILKDMDCRESEIAISNLHLASAAYKTGNIIRSGKYLADAMDYYEDFKDDRHYLNAVNLQALLMVENGKPEEALNVLTALRDEIETRYGRNRDYDTVGMTMAKILELIP